MGSLTSYNRALVRKPGGSLTGRTEPWAEARASELVLTAAAGCLKHYELFWCIKL